MHAVVRVLREILNLHARCRDVLRLDAQHPLDDAVALLAGLRPCTGNQLICRERVHLAGQIRILAQSPAELGDDLGHALHADLSSLGLYHTV